MSADMDKHRNDELKNLISNVNREEACVIASELAKKHPMILFRALEEEFISASSQLEALKSVFGGK